MYLTNNLKKIVNVSLFAALDLKKGAVYAGEPVSGTKVDTTLTIEDQDMVELVSKFMWINCSL